jgi:hypothetical protein
MAISNKNRLLEKYVQVVREDGLNTNKNVNIGIAGAGSTATLSVGKGGINTTGALNALEPVVNLTATATVTTAQSGSVITLAPAAAMVVTLPATATVGLTYTFVVTTAATGTNTLKIITGAGTQLLQGVITSATTTASVFQSVVATSNIAVAMNGTTTGGLVGSQFTFTCLSSTLWQVFGTNFTSGTTATPFSTS